MTSRRWTRRAHALLARLQALVVAVVLLFGIARGGAKYFVCPMMGPSFAESSCCAGVPHGASDVPAVEVPECCAEKKLGTLPASATTSAPEVAPVPLVAIAPPLDIVLSSSATTTFARSIHSARAGPPPSASERRALLMIWTS